MVAGTTGRRRRRGKQGEPNCEPTYDRAAADKYASLDLQWDFLETLVGNLYKSTFWKTSQNLANQFCQMFANQIRQRDPRCVCVRGLQTQNWAWSNTQSRMLLRLSFPMRLDFCTVHSCLHAEASVPAIGAAQSTHNTPPREREATMRSHGNRITSQCQIWHLELPRGVRGAVWLS